jgi:drug/metabolite transporter (DMT)-like permease
VAWLALVAVFATAGHYAMTRAFAAAPLTVTQPVTFVQLIWASLIGVFVFSEPMDGWVILGGGLMIAAISYITWREARLRTRTKTPVVSATKI